MTDNASALMLREKASAPTKAFGAQDSVDTTVHLECSWSHCQGLQENILKWRDNAIMHKSVPEECKPALYGSDGTQCSFPEPTKKNNKPRVHWAAGDFDPNNEIVKAMSRKRRANRSNEKIRGMTRGLMESDGIAWIELSNGAVAPDSGATCPIAASS